MLAWCVVEDQWWKENDKKAKIEEYQMSKLINKAYRHSTPLHMGTV